MERRSSRVMERNMRVFWAIVALLVLAGVGIPAVRMYEKKHDAEIAARAAADEARAREVEARAAVARTRAAEEAASKAAVAKNESTPTEHAPSANETRPPVSEPDLPAAATPAREGSNAAGESAPASEDLKAPESAPEPPAPSGPDIAPAATDATAPDSDSSKAEVSATRPAQSDAAGASAAQTPPAPSAEVATTAKASAEPPKPEQAPPAPPAPAPTAPAPAADAAPAANAGAPASAGPKVEKKSDGTLLVDDKYIVKGEGTKARPYEVSWDMLVSAQESYEPRQGRKRIPERLSMLNDKYVRITGYIAFPMFVDQPKELLSMLNQWDGCCIGVPPTPYDAVEVHLAEAVQKDQRASVYGVVTGKFGVKPYLAGDWLVGLYIMENASFEAKGFGGT